jgi:hypothetical protein
VLLNQIELVMTINYKKKYLIVLLPLIALCSFIISNSSMNKKDKIIKITSSIKAIELSNKYIYCDSSSKGDKSCFISFGGRRYLKKEKIIYNNLGNIMKAILYKSEGILEYNRNDLKADSAFVTLNGWNLNNNFLKLRNDSIIFPITEEIIKSNNSTNKIYCINKETGQLNIFEY